MSGRLTDAERAAAGLARPSKAIPAPGLIVTVWGSDGIHKALDASLADLAAIRPDVVQLHTQPTPDDARAIARVRELLPCARIWIGAPSDTLARGTDGAKRARDWSVLAHELGAEVLVFNGEAAWKRASPGLASAVIAAARAGAPSLPLAWTAFDHPRYHRLPWSEILGAGGVDLHLPQVYAAPEEGVASHTAALSRWASADRQWRAFPGVLDSMRLGGARCIPYVQAHHVSTAGTCALLNRGALASVWALPTRSDAAGVLAMRADAELRRRVGHAPGRVQRWQQQAGLTADGIVGQKTLDSLGLA